MDRNLLIAFVLSFLVLYGWTAWQESMRPDAPAEVAQEGGAPADATTPGDQAEAAPGEPLVERPAEAASPATPAPKPSPAPTPEAVATAVPISRIEVERPLYHAVLTSRGGSLERFELAEYTDEFGDPVALVDAERGGGDVARTPFPELGRGDLSQAPWQVASADKNEIVFAWNADGVALRKTWRFDDDGYGFRLRLDVSNGSDAPIKPEFRVEWPARVRPEQDFVELTLSALQQGEVKRTPITGLGSAGFFGWALGRKASDHEDHLGGIEWAGIQTTYFLGALLPDDPSRASARFVKVVEGEEAVVEIFFDGVELGPGHSLAREYRGYVGPKEMERLEAMAGGVDRSIDLGWSWFVPVTRGFVWLLQVLYSFIPNYGVAIILLTILVRVVTAPLTVKQMRSMEKMRRVQPRMKEIQEKYADDRQKQSEEMMRLYRLEKVNPLGGCLPMLLQLPVFIGLFYALRSSIELRHAPFFGWIRDLSAPEALFTIPGVELPVRVLPLIMGGTMFLQQKITPMQTPDPAQARMMLTIMPVMMTVLFYQFASGLVLYWMMSNVLAILHQLWIGRNLGPPTATAETRSAAPKPA